LVLAGLIRSTPWEFFYICKLAFSLRFWTNYCNFSSPL